MINRTFFEVNLIHELMKICFRATTYLKNPRKNTKYQIQFGPNFILVLSPFSKQLNEKRTSQLKGGLTRKKKRLKKKQIKKLKRND